MASAKPELSFGAPDAARSSFLPVDGFLPGLAEAVDPIAMARRLQVAMFGGGTCHQVERCVIERVKYQPGRRCTIGYQLRVRDGQTGAVRDHYLSARLFEPGAARERFEKQRRQKLEPARFGPPLIFIAELEAILWSFPNDRHQPALALIADADRLASEVAPGLVAKHWGEAWSIEAFEPSIASYVHERRCSVRATMRLHHRATGETRGWTVYGKTSGADSTAKTDQAAKRFWESEARASGAFDMPRPLGPWPDDRVVWQEAVAGRPLAAGRGEKLDADAFRRAGMATSALHGALAVGVGWSSGDTPIGRLVERANVILCGWPWLKESIAPIVARLVATAPARKLALTATAHGDLHARNILIDRDRVVLIDLDEAVDAPPMQDVGHFAAYLLWEELNADQDQPAVEASIRTFVEGYRDRASWPSPTAEITWFAAAAMISEKVFRSVTLMQPDCGHLGRFIDLADRLSRGDASVLGLMRGGEA